MCRDRTVPVDPSHTGTGRLGRPVTRRETARFGRRVTNTTNIEIHIRLASNIVAMSTDYSAVDPVGEETARNVARAALFAALMGGFAYVSFPNPLSPGVPVTLQVLGVFLAGIMLGPLWGGFSLLVYLVVGAVGVPVFASGSAGVGVLFGATGGYLLSYPLAAMVVGAIVHRGLALREYREASNALLVGGMVAGTVVIYAGGVAGLVVFGGNTVVDAIAVGVVAFLPAEAVKIVAAVGIVRSDAVAAA